MTELAAPKSKRVLVVDDDEGVRELLAFVVAKEGFEVHTAVDGEDGFTQIRRNKPDLIVLDLMLPRYGGFEVLRQLQTEEATATIPIIVVTGRYTDPTTAEMIRQESNVVDFLEKPVKPNVLSLALHRILKTAPPQARAGTS